MITRGSRLALALFVLAFAAHRTLTPMAETDLFFHLKIGQLILQTHAIPFRNLFSFTWPDYPDPDLAWGFQILVAALFSVGGFAAIVLCKCALFVVAIALVQATALRAGAARLATAAATVMAIAASDSRLVERPHLVTFVGLGALALLIVEVERGRPRALLSALPLTLVWANFHAGVFLAPLVIALYGIGLAIDRRSERSTHLPTPARVLFVAALAALTTLATPAFLWLPRYLLWHTTVGATRVIDEFRHADPWSDPWLFVLGGACVLAILVGERQWRRVLPLLAIGLLALGSVRFAAEWSLLAAPLAAAGFSRIARALPAAWRAPKWQLGATSIASLSLLAMILVERTGRPLEIGLARDVVPFDAIDFVTANGLRDRMYSDLEVGCYLAWEGYPRYRVFQDARLPAYPDEFHRALDHTSQAPAAFDALLQRYGVDAALLGYPGINMRSGSFDPDTWALVYRNSDAIVFVRRSNIRFHELIAAREIPLRIRFDFQRGARVEPISDPPDRSPVPRCEWQLRLAAALDAEGDPERAIDARIRALEDRCLSLTDEIDARFHLGARLQREGHWQLAALQYNRVIALRPDHAGALANRGFALLASDPSLARVDLARALALDPSRADVRAALEAK